MSERTTDELRRRLVDIDDEIRGLASDEFARKHDLLTESDVCRQSLSDQASPEAEEAAKEWAQRVGYKGSQEVDYEARQAMVISVGQDGTSI